MRYELKTSQFCALAQDAQWQTWLKGVAEDLSNSLKMHLKNSKSCKSNREFMMILRKKLKDRNLDDKLLKFLQNVFPIVLKPIDEEPRSSRKVISTPEELNKHKVFKMFKPRLLTFPHKMIIVDENRGSLQRRVRKFAKTKIHVDWIILEDRAYIEYFESRFREEAEKIPVNQREIFQFKKKYGHS